MTDEFIPTYVDMMLPTLQALDQLGGSGTKDELEPAVIRIMGLSDSQVGVEFPPEARQRGSKVLHRLAWARTYLKKLKAADNSSRGVWTLGPEARQYLDLPQEEAQASLRRGDAEVRRQTRLARLAEDTGGLEAEALNAGQDAQSDVESSNEDWHDVLLTLLRGLEPSGFERLAQRLLREAGFRNVEVLGRSGDGGIDGVGVYRPSLVSFPVFFQCKKYKESVGPGAVRDFRGAMSGRGEKGLLITTGTYTAEARREATRDGAPPVDLIDGHDLCDLLKEFGVGVTTAQVEVVTVDTGYFDGL